jgi:hypothetical protein
LPGNAPYFIINKFFVGFHDCDKIYNTFSGRNLDLKEGKKQPFRVQMGGLLEI